MGSVGKGRGRSLRGAELAVLLLASAVGSWAQWHELSFSGEFSNLYLRPERTAQEDSFTGLKDLYYHGSFAYVTEFAPGFYIRSGYASDPLLRRKVYSFISAQTSNITFTIGPYFGVLNTARKWFSPGMSFDVRLDVPEVLFLTLGFETNFSPILSEGDYYHSGERASFGFYVPYGIITLYGEYKTFQTRTGGAFVRDDLHQVGLSTEVFFKNFPLRYQAALDFQSLQRDYVEGNTHQLMSLLFGNRLVWDVNPAWSLFAMVEVSVFSFGWEELQYQVPPWLPLGSLRLGSRFRWTSSP